MGERVLMRDLDKKLLEETLKELNRNAVYTKFEHPHKLLDYLKDYNVTEISDYWFDEDPPECKTCHFQVSKRKRPCEYCPFLAIWKTSEECLSKLTWIDLWGPEIWDMTQEQTNEMYDCMIVDLLEEIDLTDRIYLFTLKDSTDIMIYIYLRDIKSCDYGFVLERK